MKPVQLALALTPILAIWICSPAHAESATWGWSDPIDGPHGLTQMWQEEDGATGHSLVLASGQTGQVPGDHDAKIVVVTGKFQLAV